MLESLGRSLSNIIDERFSSPLISTFVISWSLWNYKFFVLLFSDTPATQTFDLIRQVCFPEWWYYFTHGVLLPGVTTLFYFFVLPKPAQFIYGVWYHNLQATNAIRTKFEEERQLTLRESREIRKAARLTESALDQSQNELRKLKEELNEALTEAAKLRENLSNKPNRDTTEKSEIDRKLSMQDYQLLIKVANGLVNEVDAENAGSVSSLAHLGLIGLVKEDGRDGVVKLTVAGRKYLFENGFDPSVRNPPKGS